MYSNTIDREAERLYRLQLPRLFPKDEREEKKDDAPPHTDGSDTDSWSADDEDVVNVAPLKCFSEGDIAGCVASFLPSEDLGMGWIEVCAAAYMQGTVELHSRRKEVHPTLDLKDSDGKKVGAVSVVDYADHISAVYFHHLKSVFLRKTVKAGSVAIGTIYGRAALDQLVSSECGAISSITGKWFVGVDAAQLELPKMLDVTLRYECGAACRVSNFIMAPKDVTHIEALSPAVRKQADKVLSNEVEQVYIGEITYEFPPAPYRSYASRASGELEVPIAAGEKPVKVFGTQAISFLQSVGKWLSMENLVAEGSVQPLPISVFIDGFAHTTTTIPPSAGITLASPLNAVRGALTNTTTALPEQYSFRVFSGKKFTESIGPLSTATTEQQLTLLDVLPFNNMQYLQWNLKQEWLSTTTCCGWPSDVPLAHDRVLAIVVVPSFTPQVASPHVAESPMNTSEAAGSPSAGDVGGHRIRNIRAMKAKEAVREVLPSLQLYFYAFSAATEACRSGDVPALEAILEGGKGQVISGKNKRNVVVDVPPMSPAEVGPLGVSLLHTAVEHGRTAIVDVLVEHGASPQAANSMGQLPIHVAALRGHADCFPALLRAPGGMATLNAQDSSGKTPLHTCLYANFVNTALWLVEQGAKVDVKDHAGLTPADLASRILPTLGELSRAGNAQLVRTMLAVAQNPNEPPSDDAGEWYVAQLKHRLTRGRLLLDCFGDITVASKTGLVVTNMLKGTALHQAADAAQGSVCQILLQSGFVDPNAQNSNGDTALHRAAACGSIETVASLLEWASVKPSLSIRNNLGQTPLHVALLNRAGPVASVLGDLATPDELRQRDAGFMTPCHYALLLPSEFLTVTQNLLSKALTGLEEASDDVKNAIGAFTPPESALQKSFRERFPEKVVKSKTDISDTDEYPSLVEMVISRRDATMVTFVVDFMHRNLSTGRWPQGAFGRPTPALLLRAFHCDAIAVFEYLLTIEEVSSTIAEQTVTCCVGGAKDAQQIPLVAYMLLRSTSHEWIDALTRLVNDRQLQHTLATPFKMNLPELMVLEIRQYSSLIENLTGAPTEQPPNGTIGLRPQSATLGSPVRSERPVSRQSARSMADVSLAGSIRRGTPSADAARDHERSIPPQVQQQMMDRAKKRFNAVQQKWQQRSMMVQQLEVLYESFSRVLSACAPHAMAPHDEKVDFRDCIFHAGASCSTDQRCFGLLQPFLTDRHTTSHTTLFEKLEVKTNYAVQAHQGIEISKDWKGVASFHISSPNNASLMGLTGGSANGNSTTRRLSSRRSLSMPGSPSSNNLLPNGASTTGNAVLFLDDDHPFTNGFNVKLHHLICLLQYSDVMDHGAMLHALCEHRYFEAALAMLHHTSSEMVHLRSSDLEWESHTTALHMACDFGVQTLVGALLRTAQFNATEENGERMPPIHYAARSGHVPVLQVLFAAGVDANSTALFTEDDSNTTNLGLTPLHLAAKQGHLDCVRLLLDYGAAVDARTVHRQTALHFAARNGHEKVVEYLVQRGAVVHRRDDKGNSPVLLAARHGFGHVALKLVQMAKNEMLLISSTNPTTGETVAHYAAFWGQTALLERTIAIDRQRQRAAQRLKSTAPSLGSSILQRRRSSAVLSSSQVTKSPIGSPDILGLPSMPNAARAVTFEDDCFGNITEALSATAASSTITPSMLFPCAAKALGANVASGDFVAVEDEVEPCVPSAPWIEAASKQYSGLAKLGVALGAASLKTRVLPDNSQRQEAAQPKKAPLSILSSLFDATASKRAKAGDDETNESVTTAATVLGTLPLYKDAFDLDNTFVRESTITEAVDTSAEDHKSIITAQETCTQHGWQPWHYAIAVSRANICEVLRKSGYGETPADIAMDMEAYMKEKEEQDRLAHEEAERVKAATVVDFPEVEAKPSLGVTKAANDAALVIFALPPPPPPPTPKWHAAYYADIRTLYSKMGSMPRRGLSVLRDQPDSPRLARVASTCSKWNLASSSHSFMNSVHLQSLVWMVRHGLCSEVQSRLPLLKHVDEPLDSNGSTLLMVAAHYGQSEVVKILVDVGADVNKASHLAEERFAGGVSPLALASMTGRMDTVQLLLDLKADPNVKDECGNTPLHLSVLRKNFGLTKILLRNHAAIHHTNNMGDTVEDIATCLRDNNITRLLHWWAQSSVVEMVQDIEVQECRTAVEYKKWTESAKIYHRRLDMLHHGYIALSNHDADHSVPCLMYGKICKRMQVNPARSVVTQLLPYWWPEEVRLVDLGGIFLDNSGMAAVYTLTKVLPRLESLDFTGCKLSNESLTDLCRAIARHPFLRKVNISHNKGISQPKRIIELLTNNKRLVQFDVTGTAIESSTQAKILRMAEDNKRSQALCYADHDFVAQKTSPIRSRSKTPSSTAHNNSSKLKSTPVKDTPSRGSTAPSKASKHQRPIKLPSLDPPQKAAAKQ